MESSISFRVLSDQDLYKLHLAALEILERTGVLVENEEALEVLGEQGASIAKPNRVRIPSYLVDKALSTVPKKISIADRDGNRVMFLEESRSYFGANVDNPMFIDPIDGHIRDLAYKDVTSATLVTDYLPNLSFLAFGGSQISGVPAELASRVIFKQVVQLTKKPIVFCGMDARSVQDIIQMATIVKGDEEQLQQNPFVIHYSEPITPLRHTNQGIKKILICAEKNIPLIYAPMLMAGATAPATFPGVLALCVAEVLSGLVISQNKKAGAPFIFGGIPSVMDMRSMIYCYGAPELNLMCAALTDMAHYYRLPMFGTAGCGESKLADQQTAIECSLSCLMSILSGANLIHDVGHIGYGKILSLETMVMTNEIVGMLKHMVRKLDICDQTLRLDLIDKVGPGGNYLAEEHTVRHFRNWWYPELLDRKTYEDWVNSGRKSYGNRLRDKLSDILRNHRPSLLPSGTVKELDEFESEWGKI